MTPLPHTVILLHGFTGCGEVWQDVVASMPPSVRAHALDLPGHGARANHTNPGSFTFSGVCNLIAEDIRHLGSGRIALWGYSMGGRIALHYALQFPEMVSALILESASPGLAVRADRQLRSQVDDVLASRIAQDGLESFVDSWMDQPLFASQKRLSAERQARARQLRLRNSVTGLASALRGFSVGRQEPLHNRLQELMMPTLIMAGEHDTKYREIGAAMAHSIPGAQLRIIANAGHAPHWECPGETVREVLDFLGCDRRIGESERL